MAIDWVQLLASYGLAGVILVGSLLWARKRILDGELGILCESKTAKALKRDRDQAQARAAAAELASTRAQQCQRCAEQERDKAEERYIKILEELADVRQLVVKNGSGEHERIKDDAENN